MGMLDGRIALITGGGKGIGKGIALKFAKEGAKVAIGCNSNAGMAAETLEELKKYTDAILIQSDVGTPEGCHKLVDETVKAFGGIDIYVNNAALQCNDSLLEQRDMSHFNRELTVNVRAAMLMFQYTLPYLKKSEHARVIVVTSVHGKRPFTADPCYSMSKACLKMLYREAAVEFLPYGISVNAIAPGGVKIEFKTGQDPKSDAAVWRSMKKVDRSAKPRSYGIGGIPSDCAEMACFIAAYPTLYLTGSTLRLDGGGCLLL